MAESSIVGVVVSYVLEEPSNRIEFHPTGW